MNTPFDEISKAIRKAEITQRTADNNTAAMARIIKGRLKNIPCYILQDLKHELKKFNATTGEWND